MKTPYRDGTTHVIFEPLDFIARLAALIPGPRLNLTRFHGMFAPNSPYRARITPAGRGRGRQIRQVGASKGPHAAEQQAAMRWAQQLGPACRARAFAALNCEKPTSGRASPGTARCGLE